MFVYGGYQETCMMTVNEIDYLNSLRQLYRPLQPTITAAEAGVTYHEYGPAELLRPFIYCYWQLKTTHALMHPFTYRVVADGCIDFFFELNNPADSYVMGFCKKYTEFKLNDRFHYAGVRFLPTMFPLIFNIPAAELSNRYQKLQDVVPEVAHFLAAVRWRASKPETMVEMLDDFFLTKMGTLAIQTDRRFYNALRQILLRFGVLDIETEIDTGLSTRQLRRLFDFYIGDSMKTFAKVVRFQNVLRAKPSLQSLKKNPLFLDAGYYDQAHFIKEFKNFYGVTPSKAFGR